MGSINKSHNETDGGILLFNGELILLYCDSVQCEIGGKESVKGRVYLTTHRLVMIVTPYRQNSAVKSLCAPFCAITKCKVEQPVFGANYIEATVRDETDPNRSFSFKLKFSKGGAIELAMAMNRAVAVVGRSYNPSQPPPPAYTPSPGADYYQAPPTVYAPGYNCGVQMPVQQFPDRPPIGFIYASSAPPPYPGLNNPQPSPGQGPPPYAPQQQQQNPQQGPGTNYPTNWPQPYAQQPNQPQVNQGGYPGYPSSGQQQSGGYPTATAQQPSAYPGYPPQQPGAPGYPPAAPPQQAASGAGYPAQPSVPGYPPATQPSTAGYPDLGLSGNSGHSAPAAPDSTSWPSAPSFNPNWQEDKKNN